jgi:hypothetical protein
MLKQAGPVRELVISDVDRMLRHLHAMLTLRDPTEHDALVALKGPQRQDLIVDMTNFVLERFGHATAPSDPRYDKTRRAVNGLIPKGLRGNGYPPWTPFRNIAGRSKTMAHGQPDEDIYQPRVQPEDLPRKIVPRMEAVPVGQAFEGAFDASERKYQADSATWASDQIAQARVKAVQDLKTAQDNAPTGDQTGFTEKYLSTFDKNTADLAQGTASNPVASAMIQHGMTSLRQTLQTQTMGWEAQQNVAYRQDSFHKNLSAQLPIVEAHPELADQVGSTLADQVRVMGVEPSTQYQLFRAMHEQLSVAAANGLTRQNPHGVLTALNNPESASADFEPVLQLNDAQREAVRNKANEGLAKPVYSSLTDGDTDGAQTQLNAVRDILDPHNAFSLQNTIDAKVREKQNDQKQDIADRLQDSMKAAEYGLPNSVAVTRSELGILYPKDAQRHWDALQGTVAAGAMGLKMNQMKPEDAAAIRDAAYPSGGGPEAANKIQSYEILAHAFDRSMQARHADPAQFAIDNSTGWKPLDFSKPDDMLAQLRSRANTQGQVSEQSGFNTPLLSIPEQQQLTGWLGNQPPIDRLRTLAALRETLPSDQAYVSLLKQVAPGSPLTAIAGATMDRPKNGEIPNWYNPSFATSTIVGQRILEGEQILRDKDEKGITSKFPMPSDTDLKTAFDGVVGGPASDLFRGRSEMQESYWAAYKASYAAEASHAGVSSGILNQNLALRAASNVIGNATQYGPSNLVVPAGMDPTRFRGNLDAATTSALIAAGYSDKPDPAHPGNDSDIEVFRSHGYGLRELGDTLGTGRYLIIDGNGDPLKSRAGKSITVDLTQQMRIPFALPSGPVPLPSQPDAFNNPLNRDVNWGK